MCCFLLHDILKMKFEDLNLMCCCAKPNKYYQYLCKIGSVKFDHGGAALQHLNVVYVTGLFWNVSILSFKIHP